MYLIMAFAVEVVEMAAVVERGGQEERIHEVLMIPAGMETSEKVREVVLVVANVGMADGVDNRAIRAIRATRVMQARVPVEGLPTREAPTAVAMTSRCCS